MRHRAAPISPKRPIEMLEARILLARQVIWIEGESPAASTFVDYWLGATADTTKLSAGAWTVHTNGGTAYARYNFTAPEAGTYQLWLRLQTYNANYSYQIDSGSTITLSMTDVAAGSPTDSGYTGAGWSNTVIGWVYAGATNLTAGSHQIRVNANGNWGGIDAIGMTNYGWVPNGPVRPDPAATPAATDWFPFTARPDDFSSSSTIDLSYLNEDTAGSKGALKRVGDHYEFASEPGVPVKFWGIDANPVSNANIAAQARWYAKHGINIVRLAHLDGFFNPTRDVAGNMILDSAKLDQFDRFFAALKDNGIYMDWSMVWKFPIAPQDGYPTGLYNELVNTNGGETYGVVNFMPQLQQIRWRFVSTLLNHVNPYTGLKYANDPALAVVEVQNEDDIFFWNPLNAMATADAQGNFSMPLHRDELQKQWQQWVKARYGTNAALQTAWGSGFRTGSDTFGGPDGVDALDMKLYAPWELLGAGLPSWEANQKARAADFIRFLAEMQRNYYASRMQQIRDAGFQGVTVSTNWIVGENGNGGGSSTRAANLWADQAGDAIDKHDYWQGGDGDWRIVTTDTNGNGTSGEVLGTMLKSPGQGLLQVGMYQVEDRPFNYSEWSATTPSWYQAEAAPLVAFYGMGLQGWDASFQFASGNYYFNSGYEAGGFLSFYNSDTPVYMGQFPALSLAVRRGDITQGGAAAARRINLTNAFSSYDAFTQSLPNNGWGGGTGSISTNNEVLGIGRVTANVGDGLGASQRESWSTYWNQTTKTINSDTGELSWDYNKGLIKVMAQKTQAIIGFAGPGTYDLPAFTVNVTTDYVDLMFTALDNLPLATSRKILVTALSRTKQYGSAFNADGTQITQIGTEALMMQPVQATITLKDGVAQTVQVLDFYGVATGQNVPLAGNTFTIDGRYASYYYQINRSAISQPTVDLDAGSDLGVSDTDNLTGDTTPTFSGVAIPSVTVELLSDGVTVASGTAAADGSWQLTSSLLTGGVHSMIARSYVNGVWINSTALPITVDVVRPTVSATINSGVAQRSMVKRLDVLFSEPVSLSVNAIQVLLSTGAVPANTVLSVTNPSGDQRSYVLTFSGSAVIGGSLADGIYDVVVSSSAVQDLAGNTLTANYTQRFHRLFGDSDGNKIVNALDYARLKNTFARSSSDPLFNSAFDYEGNNLINALDLARFRQRYGLVYVY